MGHLIRRLTLCLLFLLLLPAVGQAAGCGKDAKAGTFEFLGRDLEEGDIFLSNYHGKVVVVTFWESWCKPCREEMPLLDALQRNLGKERLEVFAINYSEKKKQVTRFARAWDIPLELTLTYRYDRDKRGAYKVTGFPATFLFDKDGQLQESNCGYAEGSLNELVEKLLTLI